MTPSHPLDQAPAQPTLATRTWPAYAMMVHTMIGEAVRVMHEGGLTQPGAAERVQKMRAASSPG